MLSFLVLLLNFAHAQVVIIDDFSSANAHGYKVQEVLRKEYTGEIVNLSVYEYTKSLSKVLQIKPAVLNLSFGTNEYNTEEIELLKQISVQGTFIVVAAGNNNQKVNMNNPVYPCFYPVKNLICVGAANGLEKALFSNFGPKVKVFTDGSFKGENVTSFAAPRVSAFVAGTLKCHNYPLDLINHKTMTVAGQGVSLIDNKAEDFCYHHAARDPF